MQVSKHFHQRLFIFLVVASLLLPTFFSYRAPSLYAATAPHLDAQTAAPWWDAQRPYRLTLQVDSNGYQRQEQPVEVVLNFAERLQQGGHDGVVDLESLYLVELKDGVVIDEAVPFQFDPAANDAPIANPVGTLTFLLAGQSASTSTRSFHLYFALVAAEDSLTTLNFTRPHFPDLVTVTTTTDAGQSALQVTTPQATYFYQPEAGGFSSILDRDQNDWINYQPEPSASAGGAYRGIPNMVYPAEGLHPGATGHQTTVRSDGPLKATIQTTINTDDDNAIWQIEWAFFPTFARATVLANDHDYWFLYEGTPGGVFEPEQDFIVRADGLTTSVAEQWTGDLPGEEWLYFADPASDRALYLVNHNEDTIIDSYRPMSDSGGGMTVFGFGRRGVRTFFTEAEQVFTIGLVDSTAYGAVAPIVRGIYRPLSVSVGALDVAGSTTPARITITEDAQPNAKRNFRFDGDLGTFVLDDPKSDDGDAYGASYSTEVTDGVYTIRQRAATNWYLTAITCTPTASATIQLASRSVQIVAHSGEEVHCTFVNLKETTLRVQRLDGQSTHAVTLFDADGIPTVSGQSNHHGKLSFPTLLPGNYTLCVDDQPDCTPVTLTSEQLTLATIPNGAGTATITNTPIMDDEDEDWGESEDPLSPEDDEIIEGNGDPTAVSAEEEWLNTPLFQHHLYLPFISAATALE